MNNRELIDSFKSMASLATDADVANVLKQSQSTVSKWVSDRSPMPVEIKFRLLSHIGFSDETDRFAALFCNMAEYYKTIQDENDRVNEILGDSVYRVINGAEIERMEVFQKSLDLSDEQAAKFLELNPEQFIQIKKGTTHMPVFNSMWFAFLRSMISTEEWIVSKLPLSEKVKEQYLKWEKAYRRENIDKRLNKK